MNFEQNGSCDQKISQVYIIFFSPLANKFGRKQGLLYTQIFSFTGAILSGFAKTAGSYEMLIIGRFGIGIACGLFTGLVPLYM